MLLLTSADRLLGNARAVSFNNKDHRNVSKSDPQLLRPTSGAEEGIAGHSYCNSTSMVSDELPKCLLYPGSGWEWLV